MLGWDEAHHVLIVIGIVSLRIERLRRIAREHPFAREYDFARTG